MASDGVGEVRGAALNPLRSTMIRGDCFYLLQGFYGMLGLLEIMLE